MATEDWTQRLKENPPDSLEYIRQIHESWLTELEGLAVEAIATNDWTAFYTHVVGFQNEFDFHGESIIGIEEERVQPLNTLEPALMNCTVPALTLPKRPNQTNRKD
jgi:hypothetical protein